MQMGTKSFHYCRSFCLEASRELKVIDPKINLRVNRNTPLEIYESATRLTKAGLGFPQYANDDVIIDGLVEKGYDRADACNYTVAACWEFHYSPRSAWISPILVRLIFRKLVNDTIQ